MGMANDGGEKIQAVPLGAKFGQIAGVYAVEPSDRVFQAVDAGTVVVTLEDGTVVTGLVGAFVGYGIVRGTVSIECSVAFHIG